MAMLIDKTLLLLSVTTVCFSTSSSSSSNSSSSSGFEIHFPWASERAHVIIHPVLPLNVSTLFLTADLRMTRATAFPFFLSYGVRDEPNELALAVPGDSQERSYTLLMGKQGVARNDVSRFPMGEWVRVLWSWDGHNGWTALTVNGTRIFGGTHPMFKRRLKAGGKLIFGQEIDDFDELHFDPNQRFVGSIRNLRLRQISPLSAITLQFLGSLASGTNSREWFDEIVGPIPVIELKDGATFSGTAVYCNVPTEGVAFKGNQTLLQSSIVNTSTVEGCREICESGMLSAWAKGWTLYANGSCGCFKAIHAVVPTDEIETKSARVCACHLADLQNITDSLNYIEPEVYSSNLSSGSVHIHSTAKRRCREGLVTKNGREHVEFECAIAFGRGISLNWKLVEETACVKKCPSTDTIHMSGLYTYPEFSCTTATNIPGTVCKLKVPNGYYAKGQATCNENGEWDSDLKTGIITCPWPPKLTSTIYNNCVIFEYCSNLNEYKSLCHAIAKDGYTNVKGHLTCEQEKDSKSTGKGQWTESDISCNQIRCGYKPHIEDCSNWKCTNSDLVGSTCVPKPYYIVRDYWGSVASGNITCRSDAAWHMSNGSVICRKGINKQFVFLSIGLTILIAIIVSACACGWRHYVQFRSRANDRRRTRRRSRATRVAGNDRPNGLPSSILGAYNNPINSVSGNVIFMSSPPSYEDIYDGSSLPPAYDVLYLPKPEDETIISPVSSVELSNVGLPSVPNGFEDGASESTNSLSISSTAEVALPPAYDISPDNDLPEQISPRVSTRALSQLDAVSDLEAENVESNLTNTVLRDLPPPYSEQDINK